MSVAAALLAHTVPVAGLYVAAEKRAEARELFIVGYVGAVGLLLSAIAHLGGFLDSSAFAF
jgi:NAD/NADP transhydrogenase alpha subunit